VSLVLKSLDDVSGTHVRGLPGVTGRLCHGNLHITGAILRDPSRADHARAVEVLDRQAGQLRTLCEDTARLCWGAEKVGGCCGRAEIPASSVLVNSCLELTQLGSYVFVNLAVSFGTPHPALEAAACDVCLVGHHESANEEDAFDRDERGRPPSAGFLLVRAGRRHARAAEARANHPDKFTRTIQSRRLSGGRIPSTPSIAGGCRSQRFGPLLETE
jgi:hypothetical protein